ncbi:MAG: UPF0158 family protein [Bacteroidales bacterium]|nr:UPF0158 family protein [Bacteroidales bacterium]
MNKEQLLEEILIILKSVKEDKSKLKQIHSFMTEEIYEEEEIVIPDKYKKLVKEIAETTDCGNIFYLNLKTGEHIEIFANIEDNIFYDEENPFQKDIDIVDSWEDKIIIEPLESFESFKIMENFANYVSDQKLQDKLLNALNRNRPFANFKNIIDNSEYRQDWFDYKQNWLEKVVFEILESEGYITD